MQCPFCKADNDKVIDTRSCEGGKVVRRRRLCLQCQRRFTTYERIEESARMTVVKKDGSRVPYERSKIIAGLEKACYKRPVSAESLQKLAEEVEEEIFSKFDREVTSRFIGEQVTRKLRQLDKVAYVRYASVYRQFKDVGEFIDEVHDVMSQPPEPPGQQKLFEE